MEKIERVVQPCETVTDVLCNICGESCDVTIPPERQKAYEYAKIKARWGPVSTHSLETHIAHVCNSCYDAKILPLFTHYPARHRLIV